MDRTLYNQDGRILAIVNARPDEMQLYLDGYGAVGAVDGAWRWETHWVRDGQAEPFPPRPSPAHTWSWQSRSWVDERTLAQAKSSRVAAMRDARDAQIFGTLSWGGSVFDANQRSQTVIEGMFNDARMDANDPDERFRLADNTWRTLTRADKLELGAALRTHIRSAFATFEARETAINNATTVEAVEAVTWESL